MYIDKDHSQFLLKGLSLLRQNEELCDVELRVGEACVFAHKVVLSAVSSYFKAMFTGRMEESIVRTVHLHDIDEKSIALLIDFAYTGHISFSVNNVQSLLITANMLGVTKVVSACSEFLEKQLHPSNCLGFLEFADMHSLNYLKTACMKFTLENFLCLMEYDEYLSVNANMMKQIISSDNLNIHNEEDVFIFLEQWVIYDHDTRIEKLYELLPDIRFFQLSTKFIAYLLTHSFIRSTLGYQFQLKLNSIFNLKMNPFRLLDEDLEKTKYNRRNSNQIFVVGGKDGLLHPLDTCSMYNVDTDVWKACQSLPLPRFDAAAVSMNGEVFLTGGTSCSVQAGRPIRTCSSTVLTYSIKCDTWASAADMHQRRSSHVAILHGGFVYAIGGYDGKSCLKCAERYDPQTKTWTSIANMRYSRSSFASVALEEYIYVLGGHGTARLCTVERFDTKFGKWELMPAMSTKRINFGAAQVHGFIFVVGGHDGQEYLRSMERFDPVLSEWTLVSPMPSPRTGIGVAVLKKQIYVLGGHDGSKYLNSSYRYEPCSGVWSKASDMINARCYMATSDVWI